MKKQIPFLALASILAIITACGEAPEQTDNEAMPTTSTIAPVNEESSSPGLVDKTKELGKEAWDKTKEVTADTVDTVSEKSQEYYQSAKQTAGEVGESVSEKSSEIYESAKEKTSEAYQAVKESSTEVIQDTMPADEQQ